ncbi:hypothetical protein LCGC14_2432450 [marine sediment metagenome]|uniref:Uncharacterized protein n=1 Tax=marine sediment metagenome TaxID=412755 RepID=A0A0F8W188_9ZZZZ
MLEVYKIVIKDNDGYKTLFNTINGSRKLQINSWIKANIKLPIDTGNKRLLLRNCIYPPLGLHIFNCAFKEKQENLTSLTKEKQNNQEQIIT